MRRGGLSVTPPTGLSWAHSCPKSHSLEEADGPPIATSLVPPKPSGNPQLAGSLPTSVPITRRRETVAPVPRGWKSTPDAS